jgi:parallel beta helix pectate lyase-like protein
VAAEDRRLRTLLHHAARLALPILLPVRGGLPTLVLPPRPAAYTAADLSTAGALVRLPNGRGDLLVDSVLVAPGARLVLGGARLPALLMNSGADGFTSIVAWGAALDLSGTGADAPLTITGWDQDNAQPAADHGYGRPYIRAIGSRMNLRFVHASALGFWSGRTGGVAWTGVSSQPSTGGADASRFTGDTYGAFVSGTERVSFTNDLFESNELDGLRLHRNAASSTVTASTAARNGGNGFVVHRGATGNTLNGDLSVNNGGNGYLLDGRALGSGASPSGAKATPSAGTMLQGSDAELNGRTGILVEGGARAVLQRNSVCAPITAIALRDGSTGSVLTGNDVRCGGRVAVSIGPGVSGTTVAGNTLSNARIGVLIQNAPGVRLIGNALTAMSVFGISVRGATPGIVGDGNTISGHGFRPVDARAGAVSPGLTNSDSTGWIHRGHLTVLSYLRYHPILFIWVAIIALVAAASVLARLRRRRPQSLYAHRLGHHPAELIASTPTAHRWHAARQPIRLDRPEPVLVCAGGQAGTGHGRHHADALLTRPAHGLVDCLAEDREPGQDGPAVNDRVDR